MVQRFGRVCDDVLVRGEVVKAAVIQMVSGCEVEENLERCRVLLGQAAEANAELVLLPENFAVFGGGRYRAIADAEDTGTGPILRFLSETSARHGFWLVAGSIPLLGSQDAGATPAGKVFAASTVWTPEGKMAARYDKCHLFDVDVADSVGAYRESDTFVAGTAAVVTQLPSARLGLSICYDLRFPELYRMLVARGAEILTVPSAFTYTTGRDHWEVLLRTRAIENQCFVLAANQGGEHSAKRTTWGHSCIIDPWGELVAMRAEPGEGVVTGELNFARLQQVRTAMPSLQHRRW